MSTLRLEDLPGAANSKALPDNFLPMALEALQDPGDKAVYPLIGRVVKEGTGDGVREEHIGALVTLPIAADMLRDANFDPGKTFSIRTNGETIEVSLRSIAVDKSHIGPPVPQVDPILRKRAGPLEGNLRNSASFLGLIDTSIAYWNPELFRAGGVQRLESLSFIQYRDATGRTTGPVSDTLPAEELNELLQKTTGPEGDAPLRRHFAAKFPDSVYARFRGGPPAQPPGQFAHGTAMLDLLMQNLNESTRVFGLELPAEVLADAGGAALESVVELALDTLARQMLERGRIAGVDSVNGTILLPFAFLGGPHDGSRPSVEAIKELIADYGKLGLGLRLVVPMGNHLDDRIHARLRRSLDDEKNPHLVWRILPDDHSSNSIDILHKETNVKLELTSPDGSTIVFDTGTERCAVLKQHNATIGAIRTNKTGEDKEWMRTRISLGPTARREVRVPVSPAGSWRLTMVDGASLDAWILRDDATIASRAVPPQRQSFFEDAAYQRVNSAPAPVTDDQAGSQTVIRRRGTVSVLATGAFQNDDGTGIEAVGANWSRNRYAVSGAGSHGVYSGRYLPDDEDNGTFASPKMVRVDAPRPTDGYNPAPGDGERPRGTAGPRRFSVAGTSVAAAIRASKVSEAHDEAPVEQVSQVRSKKPS